MLEVARVTPEGDFAEVGVYHGGSAKLLYKLAQQQLRRLYLYDTFHGMPFADPGDSHQPGDFADVSVDQLREAMPNAIFCIGIFPDTLLLRFRTLAFVHVDCDQYRSTLAAIDRLWPVLVEGGVLWFDDFATVPAAKRAVLSRFGEAELRETVAGRAYVIRS